jgi:hypothetical protein
MRDDWQKKYPEVLMLKQTVGQYHLHFEQSNTFKIPDSSFITVKMQARNNSFIVPLMDEYKDFDVHKPSLALHLVLLACEDFEEAEDYLVWCKDLGLTVADEHCRNAWFHLREEVPKIRSLFDKQVQAIDSFDYQLGAGATQLLREIDVI